jgi:hypothetical protein
VSDSYPGDSAYTRIVQDLFDRVRGDRISMRYRNAGASISRADLCSLLVGRHNDQKNRGQSQTNAEYLGLSLAPGDCLAALETPRGYPGPAGWMDWAGLHQGTWFSPDQQFTDNARWEAPRREATRSPSSDQGRDGRPRVYDLQPVEFLNRAGAARHGWNQSHPEVPYVWGWDPKEGPDGRGQNGTHLGLPFRKGEASGIIWFTPNEVFLECIGPAGGGRRRTSTGLFGFGQWAVS